MRIKRIIVQTFGKIVRERILRHAIRVFGKESQCRMMIEEMSELTKALCKLPRGGPVENVLEEMADVQIMLDQMRLIFGSTKAMEMMKLGRLARRIQTMERKEIKDDNQPYRETTFVKGLDSVYQTGRKDVCTKPDAALADAGIHKEWENQLLG